MIEVGTLDILGEIQAIVSDKNQVVSYKWLSRNFSVSSNDAKRILREFVEQNGTGLEIVYSLSGRLKKTPPDYHIRLVSGVKLAEVKGLYEDDCSIQVYSVQACIPKDPAALWNSDFVQSEELYNQPSSAENCLRDNRFCGVSNAFVKRNSNGRFLSVASQQSKNTRVPESSRSNNALQTPTIPEQKGKEQQSNLKSEQSPAVAEPVVKTESNVSHINVKANSNTGKVANLPATKKKAPNGKSSSGTGGSLANMWGRASVKSKSTSPAEGNKDVQNTVENLATADAQICAREAIDTLGDDDDDDEAGRVNCKRAFNGEGNRKRRIVIDFSDEDDFEDAVNLGSPDPPKKQSSQMSDSDPKLLLSENISLNFEAQNGEQSKTEKETVERDFKLPPKEDEVIVNKNKTTMKPVKTPEVIVSKNKTTGKPVKTPNPEDSAHQKDKAIDNASSSTKRRRVLKTRIDERGREVTEVVWEGEETENKDIDKEEVVTETENKNTDKEEVVTETENKNTDKEEVVTETANKPSGAKKSPAVASKAPSSTAVKGAAKKAGKGVVKDAKQGNIMSFFKKA